MCVIETVSASVSYRNSTRATRVFEIILLVPRCRKLLLIDNCSRLDCVKIKRGRGNP